MPPKRAAAAVSPNTNTNNDPESPSKTKAAKSAVLAIATSAASYSENSRAPVKGNVPEMTRLEQQKDKNDFLTALDTYVPTIPEAVSRLAYSNIFQSFDVI